jgi:hypothetical protein
VRIILNFALLAVLVGFTVEQVFAPNSWWIDIRKLYVSDGVLGDPTSSMAMDDTIHRDFIATYYIDIRKLGVPTAPTAKPDLTRFNYFCTARGELSFRPGVDPAANLDLDWWSHNSCPKFVAGSYYAQLIVTWRDFLVNRSLTIDSNVWTIANPPDPIVPPAAQVIVEKPITQVTNVQKVTKTIQAPPRVIVKTRCEPSLIPPRSCPAPQYRPRKRGRKR